MVVSEIAAGIAGLNSALNIVKTMIGLRNAEAFQAKSAELARIISKSLEEAIEAREAYLAQLDRVRALETEVAGLKAWDADKERYELKPIGAGVVAYMLKPEARGSEPPHWLCPKCYAQGKKAFFQATGARLRRSTMYQCPGCQGVLATEQHPPEWLD